jgi:maltooligosyltrehalose trehalohydrolase
VWAPKRERVEVLLHPGTPAARRHPLAREDGGYFAATLEEAGTGDRYAYVLDDEGPFPDPASRAQPEGVHGPSAVVDPRAFAWSDSRWTGLALRDAVIYELHVGTFTAAGTFSAAAERLGDLASLGVTAIELMPVADFPGARNWGYDGVDLFAPARAYGTPDDLRRLVDAAHAARLAVVLDVVYNHFGPDGAYVAQFSDQYFSTVHHSPWGAAVNLDGDGSRDVRAFFIENALHWLHEYHLDGLRLDATHAFADTSPRHFLAELAAAVRDAGPTRSVLLIAEDDRNLSTIVRPVESDGWGFDAVWADDLHHQLRRRAAGDRDGYFADYSGSLADIAATITRGWFYTGQYSAFRNAARGTDPAGVPVERMVVCLQNHDQIGNRPLGDRLHHEIAPSLYRALSAVLLFVPETPLLFMGQEWAASTPFLYFTDHHDELGRLVTEGRRREFSRFEGFADPARRDRIPDPQASSTFERSTLVWDERDREPHAGMLRLYQALIAVRTSEGAGRSPEGPGSTDPGLQVSYTGASLILRRGDLVLVACLSPRDRVNMTAEVMDLRDRLDIVLSTEDMNFATDADRSRIELTMSDDATIEFEGPGAVVLRLR